MKLESKLGTVFGVILAVIVGFLGVAAAAILLIPGELQIVPLAMVGGAGLITIIATAIMWGKLKNEVATPARQIAEYAEKLAKGEVNSTLELNIQGELETIAASLNKTYEDNRELKKFLEELLKQTDFDNGIIDLPNQLGRVHLQIGECALKLAQQYKNEISEVTFMIEKLAQGEINANYRARSQKGLAKAVDALTKSLSDIETDMRTIAQSASEGNFAIAINDEKYKGAWKKVMQTVALARNATTENIKHLEDGLNELAKGILTNRIKPEAKGEYLKTITAYNNAISSLEKILTSIDADILSATASNRVRGGYVGDFAKIHKSLDGLLTAIVEPKSAAQTQSRFLTRPEGAKSVIKNTGDTNRMSGAKKITDPGKSFANAEFMRADFGKY